MDYLDSVFDLVLSILEKLVEDARLGALFWMFILVIIALVLVKIWRGVFGWTR